MSRWYILNDAGEPVHEPDMLKAAKAFETQDRTVAKTTVGKSEVSTVFLGLDHSHGGPVPLLFETMVFGGPLDDECERYPTRAAALAGHDYMATRVRDAAATGGTP